jgi:hypothetical protein
MLAMGATDDIEQTGKQVADSEPFEWAIRFGLVAYGVVHLLLSWVALQLAFGQAHNKASSKGALQQLAGQPFGGVALWAVAIGMAVLVVWRLLEASVGHQQYATDEGKRWRKRATSLMKAVIYGAVAVSAFKTASGAGSKSKGGSKAMTAQLMQHSWGTFVVALIGLAIIGYGGNTAWRGWKEKFMEHLDFDGRTGKDGRAYRLFGKFGYIAKGVAIGIVGGLFLYAALTHDSSKAGGLDQALHKVLQQPFGQVLLIAIAVGIGCYGLFCFARARHLAE